MTKLNIENKSDSELYPLLDSTMERNKMFDAYMKRLNSIIYDGFGIPKHLRGE